MKKKFIICLFLPFGIIPLTSKGQISTGTTLLGGNVGYSSTTFKNTAGDNSEIKSHYINLTPKAGYFVTQNLVIGAALGLSTGAQKYNDEFQFKQNGFSVGPFVRYYKFLSERTALFGNAAFSYNENNVKTPGSNNKLTSYQKQENVSATLTPGLTYFATSKIGLEITLGYIGYTKNINESELNSPNIYKATRSGFSKYYGLANSSLGVNFYLGR